MSRFEKIITAIIWALCIALVVLVVCVIVACVTGNVGMTPEEADFIVRTNATTSGFNATNVCVLIQ